MIQLNKGETFSTKARLTLTYLFRLAEEILG